MCHPVGHISNFPAEPDRALHWLVVGSLPINEVATQSLVNLAGIFSVAIIAPASDFFTAHRNEIVGVLVKQFQLHDVILRSVGPILQSLFI